ncbi:MAG: hypothetical protein K8U03_00360 [Planctomycetia bacterium]|nr:hypothetical protein [Planctomycetia bacterium]
MKQHQAVLFALSLAVAYCPAPPLVAQQETVFDVGSRSQLFVDQYLVQETSRIAFTPHAARKHPGNPILKADQLWEGWYVTAFCGTILFDEEERRFKMWYGIAGDKDFFPHGGICYAVSPDGLKWEKPTIGTVSSANGRPHNCVAPFLLPSVFKDAADSEPNRRYKMICFDVDRGYLAFLSPDGLKWTEQSSKPIVPISYVDDVVSAFRDHRTGRFIALPKMMSPVLGRSRRTIYLSSSLDFRDWTKLEPAFVADRRDDLGSLPRIERSRSLLHHPDNLNVVRSEFYGAGAYSAESCVIGFPWVFTINANTRGNQEGPIEPQLAVSRDLQHWQRPFRTPILPFGKPGEWDSGMILTASQAIDVGDEVRLYYGGTNYTHGAPVLYGDKPEERGTKYTGAIGLATWRRDRFVSADGPVEGGTLTTVPIRFSGKRLELNGVTYTDGEIRVELLDAAGKPLAGFGLSEPITGDHLRHEVRFPGGVQVSSLAGRAISLRFHLRSAELYAFAFRDPPQK